MDRLQKRSLTLSGHATSVSLEPEFWEVLELAARERGLSVSALIAALDAERVHAMPDRPLASFCRVHALLWALKRLDQGEPTNRSLS